MSVEVIFYKDHGSCPVKVWLDSLDSKAKAKGSVRIERLECMGHLLRRPEADYLKDGIYELRWRLQSVNYRILYFFYGREAVILAHGVTKEDIIPEQDIMKAIQRKIAFEKSPSEHSEGR